MTPGEFIAKWRASELKERSAAQEHFIDLCRLLDEPTPAEADPTGEHYCFERGARKDTGGDGWADVSKRHCFAWEYKGKHVDLDGDAGVATLGYPVRVDDPDHRASVAGMDTIIAALEAPGTGVIARIETAIALHEAHGGEATPLGSYRPSLRHGDERSAPAARGRAGPGHLFALERAPEPVRAPGSGTAKGRSKRRDGTPLEALQKVGAHWKRQAHGPKHTKRRWIVIDEYERGPKAEIQAGGEFAQAPTPVPGW